MIPVFEHHCTKTSEMCAPRINFLKAQARCLKTALLQTTVAGIPAAAFVPSTTGPCQDPPRRLGGEETVLDRNHGGGCAVLFGRLQKKVQSLFEAGDPRWQCLLACWQVCVGVVRVQQMNRARPVKLAPWTLHCRCPRGRQHPLRSGFHFALPAAFLNGWGWAQRWFQGYQRLPAV